MKLTIVASIAVYVTLALILQEPRKNVVVVGHVLDLPPEFLHDASSNILELEAMAAMSKGSGHSSSSSGSNNGGRSGATIVSDMELDGARKSHHCSVEMKMRIPGKCKYMGRAGVACVAGDYMDLVNQQCMM